MLRRRQSFVVLTLFAFVGMVLVAAPGWADLEKYVRKPEPAFRWELKGRLEQSGDRIYDLHFVSQIWQEITWEHQLQVYQPQGVGPNAAMLLWITGGSARPAHISMGLELARKIGAPAAFLFHIPNQPLLESKLREDDLIAETFVRYLKTRDENWPLLLPMVKSVVKAMDVLQAFSKREWSEPIQRFILSGSSKRGWTAWLTAAVESRVKAIAPAVIDTLNMRAQMPRQLEAFGAYSARLAPYINRGLVPIPETAEGKRLLSMVDPWTYRDRLILPKLIINGSNDFYWVTDALNLYWEGLKGDKWVLYVPNAGHDLLRQDKANLDRFADVVNGLAAFARYQMSDRPMPRLTWKYDKANGKLRLTVEAKPAPTGARLWVAQASTQDFRKAKWREQPVIVSKGRVIGEVTPPEEGYLAYYSELDYEIGGVKYHLSTQVRMMGKPDAGKE